MSFTNTTVRNFFSLLKPYQVLQTVRDNVLPPDRPAYLEKLMCEIYDPTLLIDYPTLFQLKKILSQSIAIDKEKDFLLTTFWEEEFLRLQLKKGDLLLDPSMEIASLPESGCNLGEYCEKFYRDLEILDEKSVLLFDSKGEMDPIKAGKHIFITDGFRDYNYKIYRSDIRVRRNNTIVLTIFGFPKEIDRFIVDSENVLQVHRISLARYLILTEKGFYSLTIDSDKTVGIRSILNVDVKLTGEIVGNAQGKTFIVKSKENTLMLLNIDRGKGTLEQMKTISSSEKVDFYPEAGIVTLLESPRSLSFLFIDEANHHQLISVEGLYSFTTVVTFADEKVPPFVAIQDENTMEWKKLVKNAASPVEPLSEEESEYLRTFPREEFSTTLNLKPAKVAVLKDSKVVRLMQHIDVE